MILSKKIESGAVSATITGLRCGCGWDERGHFHMCGFCSKKASFRQ